MNKLSWKKQLFSIFLVIGWVLFCLACGPLPGDKKDQKKPLPKDIEYVKKPRVLPTIKPRKTPKPAPVFEVQAELVTAGGEVIEVDHFAFYSGHTRFSSGFYTPSSGTRKWSCLYLKQGYTWKKFDFAKIKSLTMTREKSYSDWLHIALETTNGEKTRGTLPTEAYNNLWYAQGYLYLTGKSEVLGRVGSFKCSFKDISRIEQLAEETPPQGPTTPGAEETIPVNGAATPAEGSAPSTVKGAERVSPPVEAAGETTGAAPPGGSLAAAEEKMKFKVIYGQKEETENIVLEPGLLFSWKGAIPRYLTQYDLKKSMPVTVNNTEIKIKPAEIESVTTARSYNGLHTIKMKKGETVKAKLPPRVYGELKNGDIIFTDVFSGGKPVFKTIRIIAKAPEKKSPQPGRPQ